VRVAAVVIRGDARNLPLPDGSVDLIVTSPPYFSLRSYIDADGMHYDGQIGSETTPRQFIDALLACTVEWRRVLKPSGSMFINLGDTYSSWQGERKHHPRDLTGERASRGEGGGNLRSAPGVWGVPAKSLIGVPWRYALGCVDELGLILRRDIIWSKSNGIPESVKDRARTAHEYIFHLTKQQRYFSAVDEIREDHAPESFARFAPGQKQAGLSRRSNYGGQPAHTLSLENSLHPLGRLPGSVWEFPVQPLVGPACRIVWDGRTIRWFGTWAEGEKHMRMLAREWWSWPPGSGRPSLRSEAEHFAAFPMELPRRIIQGWSPDGICVACGQGRRPVSVVTDKKATGYDTRIVPMSRDTVHGHDGRGGKKILTTRGITGYACDCPDTSAPTRPAVVLDPFGGTGCTAMVAAANGRIGITVDYSHTYSRFARWRTSDASERAKAMQVRKPPPPPDPRQQPLFDMEEL
jgi:DNA modification methylase